jgi:hypothetical protein
MMQGQNLANTGKAGRDGSDTVSLEIIWQTGEFCRWLSVIEVR